MGFLGEDTSVYERTQVKEISYVYIVVVRLKDRPLNLVKAFRLLENANKYVDDLSIDYEEASVVCTRVDDYDISIF